MSKGRGRLEPGGQGRVRLSVGPFSSLYTGWASTGILARTGHLEASHETDCAILDEAFAGPVPWIHDEF